MTNELKELLPHLQREGFDLASHSPGDGVTRYRIVPRGRDYYSGPSVVAALGAREAALAVRAFLAGCEEGRKANK
jgi:hypothetical protein